MKKNAIVNSMGETPAHFAHLRGKFVTIVAFGDSITAVNHHTLGCLNWVGLLGMGLLGRDVFPQGFTVINSGSSGDNMVKALVRIDRDVLRFSPDLAILSSCVGDMVQLMNDPIHPNAIGHRRFYHELAPLFNAHRNFFYEWERILRHEGEMS